MNIKLNENSEIHFSDYVEIVAINDDSLIFSLYYSKNTGFCLLVEDIDSYEENNHKKISELTILDDLIKVVDINGEESYLNIRIKDVNVYNGNKRNIEGNLLKYNNEIAEKYNLNKEFAYDNIKNKKRTKTVAN